MLDLPAKDDGIAGAKLGIEDDNTTGKFLNQTFKLDVLQRRRRRADQRRD